MLFSKKLNKKQEEEIIRKVRSFISEGEHCEEKHARCEENQRYVRGEQWSKADIERQEQREKPTVPWNNVFKTVHAIANKEMVERFVPKVFGRNDTDGGIANVIDEACRWQRQGSSSEHFESMCYRNTTMAGYGWMHKYWSPVGQNGSGAIMDEDVPIWEMLWPVRARQTNLSDRRWHIRGKWMDDDQIESMWGDVPKVRKKLKSWRTSAKYAMPGEPVVTNTDIGLTKPSSSISFGWESVRAGRWVNRAKNEVFVIEVEWLEIEKIYSVDIPLRWGDWVAFQSGQPLQVPNIDSNTGQDMGAMTIDFNQYIQMDPMEQEGLMQMVLSETETVQMTTRRELTEFAESYERLTGKEFVQFSERSKEVVQYAIVIEDMVLDFGERPFGYSYYCITGFPFETRDGADFYGIVDIIKGPQDYKNAVMSTALAMYMASPKAPMLVERSAIPNIGEFLDQIASPAAVAVVPDGFLSSNKLLIMPPPTFPHMISTILELADKGVEEAVGLSSIDLGNQSDLRRVSGTVVQAAKTASNVVIAALFDSLRLFRRQYGLCNVKFISYVYTPEEIIRVVGEDKAEDLASVPGDWGDVFKYDIVIDEQPSTPTEMMELIDFLTRTGTIDNWLQAGYLAFEDVLRLMPQIPESEKRKILKNKTLKDQLSQMQQQMQTTGDMINQLTQFMQSKEGGLDMLQEFMAIYQSRQIASGQPPSDPSQGS